MATGRSLAPRSPTEYGCLSVIAKPQQRGGLGPQELSSRKRKSCGIREDMISAQGATGVLAQFSHSHGTEAGSLLQLTK